MGVRHRDITFDILKGIAIFCMVLGHCFIPLRVHDFIYMWHMPFFFLISGYFFKMKDTIEELNAIWKGLLAPYLVTATVLVAMFYLKDFAVGSSDGPTKLINVLTIDVFLCKDYPDIVVGDVGPIWFLLALAWCRILYHFLCIFKFNTWLKTALTIVFSYVAYRISKFSLMPLFMLHGCVALQFYSIGHMFRQYKDTIINYKIPVFICSFPLFILASLYCRMEMWGLYFNHYILNITAALVTSLFIYFAVQKYMSNSKGVLPIIFSKIGKLSILVLVIHTIDKCFHLSDIFMDLLCLGNENIWYLRLIKISFSLVFSFGGMYMVRNIALIKKIYNIK